MSREAMPQFEVPTEVRAFAEKSVEQARQALHGFASAAGQAASSFQGRTVAAQAGARDISEKAMAFAEQNVSSSFDFLQKLVQATDIDEVVKLHSDYVVKQMEALAGQAKELGQAASRMAMDTAKPKG